MGWCWLAALATGCPEEAPRAPETIGTSGAPTRPRPSEPPRDEVHEAARAEDVAAPHVHEVSATAESDHEPVVVTELPELCRQACSNALKLVLSELPENTAQAMREELRQAMQRDCPGRCLQRASLESARCGASAKSALELAACP